MSYKNNIPKALINLFRNTWKSNVYGCCLSKAKFWIQRKIELNEAFCNSFVENFYSWEILEMEIEEGRAPLLHSTNKREKSHLLYHDNFRQWWIKNFVNNRPIYHHLLETKFGHRMATTATNNWLCPIMAVFLI